jgi:hypothetical protein
MKSTRTLRSSAHALPIAALAVLTLAALPARAEVFIPTTTNDSAGSCGAECSLRQAIIAANANPGPDVIVLSAGIYSLFVAGADEQAGATGDLDILDDLSIVGDGAGSTIIDGRQLDRVLDIHSGVTVDILGVTLRNGKAGQGGAVLSSGKLTLTRSVVADSTATSGFGGGVLSDGNASDLTLLQTTISGNTAFGGGGGLAVRNSLAASETTISGNRSATGQGGGVYVFADTNASFLDVTITQNTAALGAGGVFAESAPFTSVKHASFKSSILAGNTAPTHPDCSGAVRSDGWNLVGVGDDCIDFGPSHTDLVGTPAAPVNPKLGPLQNNGGPTSTHLPQADSLAINRGNGCGPIDQRGQARPVGSCDVGAVEVAEGGCLTGGTTLCLNNDRFKVTVVWKTRKGDTGAGQAIRLTTDSGYFWFFDPSNVELTIKVLNGCGTNSRFWVFMSGLTNVQVTVTVTDTLSGQVKTYINPQGTDFVPRLDTQAFATCG